MEKSNYFNRQFYDFMGDSVGSSQVSTELQLKTPTTHSSLSVTPQTTFPTFNNYFQASKKPGPNALTEVTITEVRKTQFLTSSSAIERLLSFNQDSGFFRDGESHDFRPSFNPFGQEYLLFSGRKTHECREPLIPSCQDSLFARAGETQSSFPKVPKIEPITENELNLGTDVPPPPGFGKKYGLGSEHHVLPSHQASFVSSREETKDRFPGPKTEPDTRNELNSAAKIRPPRGFSNKIGPSGAIVKTFDLNKEYKKKDGSGDGGRLRSLPHKKFGPYQCPECLEMFKNSQNYANHVSTRHKTLAGKRKRCFQKYINRKYKRVQTPDGITVVQDRYSIPINNAVEVVLRDNGENGVAWDQPIQSPLEETVKNRMGISHPGKGHLGIREIRTKEEIAEVMKGLFLSSCGKSWSPETQKTVDVTSSQIQNEAQKNVYVGSSSNQNQKCPPWKGPSGYLKRTKPC